MDARSFTRDSLVFAVCWWHYGLRYGCVDNDNTTTTTLHIAVSIFMSELLLFLFLLVLSSLQVSSLIVVRTHVTSRCLTTPSSSNLHLSSNAAEANDHLDWRVYQTSSSPLQHKFESAGGVLYRTSVFSSEDCSDISRDISLLSNSLAEETTSSVARKRIGAPLPPASKTYQILENGSLAKLVHQTVGSDYELATDIPVEVRVYEEVGAGMEWHVDDMLYDPPQVEVVYTLENNSDCVTMWRETSDELKSVETDANSALLLRAGGVSHCVSSLKHGRRVILKCAFVPKGATKVEEHVQQFAEVTKKKTKKRTRKG